MPDNDEALLGIIRTANEANARDSRRWRAALAPPTTAEQAVVGLRLMHYIEQGAVELANAEADKLADLMEKTE